jgi:hypothetical protein
MPKALVLNQLNDELAYVRAMLDDDSLPFTLRRMWETRRDDIQQTMRTEEARLGTHASVALAFDGGPVVGRSAIDLEFSARALESFQALVANVYAEGVAAVAGRGPVRNKADSKLFIEDVMHGSMGFILSERPAEQTEAMPTALNEAVERVLTLIDRASSDNSQQFDQILSESSPRTIISLRRLSEVMHTAGAVAKISSDESSRSLSAVALDRMFVRLTNSVKSEEGIILHGELGGLFPDREEFEFTVTEGGVVLHGKASQNILEQYIDPGFRSRYLNSPVSGQFTRTIVTRPGQPEAIHFVLDHVFEQRIKPTVADTPSLL